MVQPKNRYYRDQVIFWVRRSAAYFVLKFAFQKKIERLKTNIVQEGELELLMKIASENYIIYSLI